MKEAYNQRAKDRIRLGYTAAARTKARLKAKRSHWERLAARFSIRRFFASIGKFLRRLFGHTWQPKQIASRLYVYEGPARAKQPNALRFGVYMRRRGRKYKKARRAA